MVMILVMIIFLSFMGMPTGLNPIASSVGVNINATTGQLEDADVSSSNFWTILFSESAVTILGVEFSKGILISLVGAGLVIIGLFAKGYDTSLVILPIVIFIAGLFVSTFWILISYVNSMDITWMTALVTTIFGGLGLGFVMSAIDYFGAR